MSFIGKVFLPINGDNIWRVEQCLAYRQCLYKYLFYIRVTGFHSDNEVSISSTTNWNKSQSNCKDSNSKKNHATDLCELSKDIGMWTNIYRVEIPSHVYHGNTFYNNIYPAIITFTYILYE